MYIIIDGMPSSGKTTLSKALTEKISAVYYKSLLPNDDFGNMLRRLRDSNQNTANVDLLHIVDLYRNELAVKKLLDSSDTVIRDKCFLSSLAHFFAVDTGMDKDVKEAALAAYEQLAEMMFKPDAVVFLDRTLDETRHMSSEKADLTAIDKTILNDSNRFVTQHHYLKGFAQKYFSYRLIVIDKAMSVEDEVNYILTKVGSI